MIKPLILLFAAIFLVACDKPTFKTFNNKKANKVIIKNEGTMIGEGVLIVKGVKVEAKNTRLYANSVYYGSIPDDATTLLHVYDNGTFVLTVNGERRHPVVKKEKREDARKDMNLKFNQTR